FRGRDVVFLGYSGNDDFDLRPLLRNFSPPHRYIWIRHAPSLAQCISAAAIRSARGPHEDIVASKRYSLLIEADTRDVLGYLDNFRYAQSHVTMGSASVLWREELARHFHNIGLDSYSKHRFIGKLLQYNRHYKQAGSCFNHALSISHGIQRAV